MTKPADQSVDGEGASPLEDQAELTAQEMAGFKESLDQASRGERATDQQVQAVWAKHGL